MPVQLMACRSIHLAQAITGYQKTGITLVEHDGTNIVPGLRYDDIGLYCIIPKIVTFFGISLDRAVFLFFYGLSGLALASGCIGFFFLYRSWLARCVALVGLSLLTFVSTRFIDVYELYAITAIALIPWIIYFVNHKPSRIFFLFSFVAGMGIGITHYIRAHAGTAVLLFFCTLVLTALKDTWWKKLALIGCLLLGISAPVWYFTSVLNRCVAYTHQHLPHKNTEVSLHPLWHPIYVGFGFLNNPFGIQYDDSVAHKKAMSLDPSICITDPYPSPLSEKLLRGEIISMVRNHPAFVIHTIFAKIGILLFYFLLFANFGLVAFFLYPLSWQLSEAFFLALSFNSLFPIIAIPFYGYMLGFLACSTLFGIVSINTAVEHWLRKKRSFFVRH